MQTTLTDDRDLLLASYRRVRSLTDQLCEPLSPEDQCAQSMPDASPAKWHRAHTTWFFETFVLVPDAPGYRRLDDRYNYLFNSYYDAVGARHTRAERGLLTRPSCDQVAAYRTHVDSEMEALITDCSPRVFARIADTIELGLHHEQQHQELTLMDFKHALSRNSFAEHYRPAPVEAAAASARPLQWNAFDGGLIDIGAPTRGFSFDNEGPQHTVLLQPFELADRLTTAGEWMEFIADGGYERPELWLSDGYGVAQRDGWRAPLYWERHDDTFSLLTLHGRRPVRPEEPVLHISHFEADAFARWSGCRLATEFEWEAAASTPADSDHLLDEASPFDRPLHVQAARDSRQQMFGSAWEWTASAYLPYPRFAPAPGAIGEYNGKFMSGQMVLRGGSFATPRSHIRPSYRNFFYPHQRWMFSGVRLARDVTQ